MDRAAGIVEERLTIRDLTGRPPVPVQHDELVVPTPDTTATLAGDFSIGLWVEVPADRAGAAGGLASKFDTANRRGFNLATVSSAAGYNGPGDELRVSFGIDAGTEPLWTDRGRPSKTSNFSTSLTVFEGSLHAASNDGRTKEDWAHVFRMVDETEWEDLGRVSREGSHGIGPMVVHRGSLLVAAWNHDYTRVHHQDLKPCRVYRYEAPGRWEDCGQPGDSRRLFSIGSYHGDLYVVGDDFTVHVYRGGQKWELVRKLTTFVHPVAVHDGLLNLATWENPPIVLTFDGATWSDLGNPLNDYERCSQIHALTVYRGNLHAGHWPLGRVSRWDAGAQRWRQCGRLGDSTEINALAPFNGKLYAGCLPRAEVFRYERDRDWTSLRRFRDEPGWRPLLVANFPRANDLDLRIRSMGRVTSLTEHRGLLFASVTSCTGAATDAPADERGSVHALQAGVVATTSRSLDAGWHHVAGVRQAGRLTIYVDGRKAAESTGDITGSIANEVPLLIDRQRANSTARGRHGFVAADHPWSEQELGRTMDRTRPGAAAHP